MVLLNERDPGTPPNRLMWGEGCRTPKSGGLVFWVLWDPAGTVLCRISESSRPVWTGRECPRDLVSEDFLHLLCRRNPIKFYLTEVFRDPVPLSISTGSKQSWGEGGAPKWLPTKLCLWVSSHCSPGKGKYPEKSLQQVGSICSCTSLGSYSLSATYSSMVPTYIPQWFLY